MWSYILFLGCSGGFFFSFPWFNFGRYIVVIHSWFAGYAVFFWIGWSNHWIFFLRDSLAKFVSKCVFWNFWTCHCAVMRIYCNLLLCQNFLINYVSLLFYFECICNFFEARPEWGSTESNQYKKKKNKNSCICGFGNKLVQLKCI